MEVPGIASITGPSSAATFHSAMCGIGNQPLHYVTSILPCVASDNQPLHSVACHKASLMFQVDVRRVEMCLGASYSNFQRNGGRSAPAICTSAAFIPLSLAPCLIQYSTVTAERVHKSSGSGNTPGFRTIKLSPPKPPARHHLPRPPFIYMSRY